MIENLLIKLGKIRSEKSKAVEIQKYSDAAYLRDQEKQTYREIYQLLNNGSTDYNWSSDEMVEKSIINFLNLKYNILLTKEDIDYKNIRILIRNLKLKKLGL